MAKRSVYIPDSLWEEIQKSVHGLNLSVSEIVQNALRQVFVKTSRPSPGAEGAFPFRKPTIDAEVLDKLRRRFQREAQASYEDGFRVGTELAGRLSWAQLNTLASAGWRVPANEPWFGDDEGTWSTAREVLVREWGEGWAKLLEQEPMRQKGLCDALHEIWSYVNSAGE